jgi:glutathione peroxidase
MNARLPTYAALAVLALAAGCQPKAVGPNMLGAEAPARIYGFQVETADGGEQSLADYQGKVLLIVNVASKCGFTPQYEGLEALREKYHDRGFEVLGFPCNQFKGQEPGTNAEIQQFCRQTYGVRFPVFAKIEVNGDGTHPLYQYLKKEAPGLGGTEAIKWNFTKFLIAKDGSVVKRFAPSTKPEAIVPDIEAQLAK